MSTSPRINTNTPADYVDSFVGNATQASDMTAVSGKPKHEPMIELVNLNALLQEVVLVSEDVVRGVPGTSTTIAGSTFSVFLAPSQRYQLQVAVKSITSASVAAADIHVVAYWYNGGNNSFNA